MIELARHIEVLLLENDCVIVPGLGGFVTHLVPARYVSEEGRFLPPYRTLGFSPNMQLNDGLLVQSYMQAYDATYPEALRIINTKVQQITDTLEQDGELELHGIGTLRQNISGEYTFTPLESGLLSPNLYGFSSFEIPTLKQLEEKDTHDRIDSLQPMQLTGSEKKERKTVIIQMNYTWAASIAAACIGIIFCLIVALPSPTGSSKLAAIRPITEWFSKSSKGEVKMTATTKSETPKATKKAVKPTPKDSIASVQEPKAEETATITSQAENQDSAYYTIVLISCVPKANAERFINELSTEGYKDAQLLIKNNITRVTYARFASEAEAFNQLRTLRKESPNFAESWILKVK